MCAIKNQEETDAFFELLILAYFKQYHRQYSFSDIAYKIGLSEMQVSDYISELLEKKQLLYDNNLIRMSLSGRNRLADSSMEYYDFEADINSLYENNRWAVSQVYCPHEFSKNNWRGSK